MRTKKGTVFFADGAERDILVGLTTGDKQLGGFLSDEKYIFCIVDFTFIMAFCQGFGAR